MHGKTMMWPVFAAIATLAMTATTASACDLAIPGNQMQASASNTVSSSSVANLIDGNTGTAWVSGGFAAQWVQVDLGQKRPVCSLRLTVAQSPAGAVKHTVLIGDTAETLTEFSVVQRTATDGDTIDVPVMANTRFVRIRTDSSPSWVAWRELQAFSGQSAGLPVNAAGLTYYGFWASGGSVTEPDPTPITSNNVQYNATSKISGYTNFTTARVWFVADRVAELNALGATSSKVVVDLYDIFFNPNSPYATEWQLRGIDTLIATHGHRIAAFTLIDEPDTKTTITDAAMNERIAFLKARLAALGKSIPVFVDYSYLAFDTGRWPGFASADWVSFNCYPQEHHVGSTAWNRYDVCYNGNTITGYVDRLKAKLATNQKIVLFPQSYYRVAPGSAPTTSTPVPANEKKQMVEVIDHVMQLAENDPKVVAVMNFIYQSYDNPAGDVPEAWVGAEWLTDSVAERDVRGRLMEAGLCHRQGFVACLPRRLRPITVAASAGVASAGNAFDDNPLTTWSAGGFALPGQSQWIRMTFPRRIGISEIRLTPSQSPVCAVTTHEIWGGPAEASMTRLAEVTRNTCDNTPFPATGFWRNNDISVLEVRTISSPSWVAWRDIQVFR